MINPINEKHQEKDLSDDRRHDGFIASRRYNKKRDRVFLNKKDEQEKELDPRFYNLFSLDGTKNTKRRIRVVREDGSYFSIPYDDVHTV